jgi:hypothetical protein
VTNLQIPDLCGYRRCLIVDPDGIDVPATINGRPLLEAKGQTSELELHTNRPRRLLRRPRFTACCVATCGLILGGALAISHHEAVSTFLSRLVLGFSLPMIAVTAVWTLWLLVGHSRWAWP